MSSSWLSPLKTPALLNLLTPVRNTNRRYYRVLKKGYARAHFASPIQGEMRFRITNAPDPVVGIGGLEDSVEALEQLTHPDGHGSVVEIVQNGLVVLIDHDYCLFQTLVGHPFEQGVQALTG